MSQSTVRTWWQDAVVYQLYVRSFADANGDGVGDLAGIRRRLDHLVGLGVDAIWLNPCYPSPQWDHGYDISNYVDIEPAYGDLEEFDLLVAQANERGIRVMMDIVANHCSWDHPWFVAAVAAPPGSPERERFWFRDGRGPDGDEPPNNWQSIFGGPAWSRVVEADGVPGQWYLHVFAPQQPDLNWNHVEVAASFDDVLRFWFDRGVDGFRADAVVVLGKADGLPDWTDEPASWGIVPSNPHFNYRPNGHDVWRRWRAVVDEYMADHPGRELALICEAYAPSTDVLRSYVNDQEFQQCFAFDLQRAPWNPAALRAAIEMTTSALLPLGLHPAWTLNNHDSHRAVTRRGRADAAVSTDDALLDAQSPIDVALGTRRANALLLLTLGLPGSIYLYAGEELGLPEVLDLADEARQDPMFARSEGRELGRDGCRVPMPWTADPGTSYGFSSHVAAAEPWLPQPTDWGRFAAAGQGADAGSTLTFYGAALAARRSFDAFSGAPFTWLSTGHEQLIGFARGSVIVLLNVGDALIALPRDVAASRLVMSSDVLQTGTESIAGNTCLWLELDA